jgi:anti-sigma regulatory factor (Ser/Thr protein kinase)
MIGRRMEKLSADEEFPCFEEKNRSVRIFRSDVNCLGAVQAFIRDLMEKAGIARDEIGRVELAVEEVFVNIALYAYKENKSGGDVTVSCCVSPKIVSLEFADAGTPFNPIKWEGPAAISDAEKREPRSLGIFLLKGLMDVIEYRREGGKNVLHISKHVRRGESK